MAAAIISIDIGVDVDRTVMMTKRAVGVIAGGSLLHFSLQGRFAYRGLILGWREEGNISPPSHQQKKKLSPIELIVEFWFNWIFALSGKQRLYQFVGKIAVSRYKEKSVPLRHLSWYQQLTGLSGT